MPKVSVKLDHTHGLERMMSVRMRKCVSMYECVCVHAHAHVRMCVCVSEAEFHIWIRLKPNGGKYDGVGTRNLMPGTLLEILPWLWAVGQMRSSLGLKGGHVPSGTAVVKGKSHC